VTHGVYSGSKLTPMYPSTNDCSTAATILSVWAWVAAVVFTFSSVRM